jgi:2-methylcitrate dehydratase PrpD
MSYSEQAAQWMARLKFSDLPADVVASTKLRVLDVIGLALAAVPMATGKSVRAAALAMGSGNDARILGSGERVPAMQAALANGTMAQALEYDDTHNETVIHISSPMVATALAVGEMVKASGEQVITAVAGGNELTCRIGLVAPQQFHKVGFHPSGVIGTFGTAYTAGKLLGLDVEQMRNAVGIAGSQASGILACWEDGTQSKFLHPGWSALSGIAAALLARAGYTGPAPVFESRFGLFASHVQDRNYKPDFPRMLAKLGATWESRNTSFKPYPTAHVIHSFLDAILHLYRNEGLRAGQVEKIVCPIAAYMIPVVCEPVAEKIAPATDSHGRVSLQYSLAEALYCGKLSVDGYSEQNLRDPQILALARKISYVIDKDAPGRGQYKGWVVVHTNDGRKLERIEPYNRGSAENPISADDVRAKFRENAARVLDKSNIEAVIGKIDRLEQESAIGTLIDLCVRPGGD